MRKTIKYIHDELVNTGEVQSIFSSDKKEVDLKNGKKIQVYRLLENRDDVQEVIEQNRSSVIAYLMVKKIPEVNKNKKVALRKFLKDYLSGLTRREYGEIQSKINYYFELYQIYGLNQSEKLDKYMVKDINSFSDIDILYELLYNNTLLPEYINKNQFNEEMLKFIPRLERTINNFRLKKSQIIIPPVSMKKMMEFLKEKQTYRVLGSNVIKGGIIKQIAYDFFIGEMQSINESNEFSFSFLINDENLLSREEFIVYLKEILRLKNIQDNKEFLYESDSFFNYSIYVGEEMYNIEDEIIENFKKEGLSSNEDGYIYNGFEVKIYTQSKRNFKTEEELYNICSNLPSITERFIEDIYNTYGRLDGEMIGFPEKPLVFNVSDNLNVFDKGTEFDDGTDGKELLKSKSGTETIEIPFNVIDLDKREKVELLLNNELRLFIKTIVEQINNPQKFIDVGLTNLDTGVIFYGPGGVGKSELCYEIAYDTKEKTDFSKLELSLLFNQYLGNSEKMVKKIFNELRLRYQTTNRIQILFIDEIDGLISNGQSEVLSGVRSVLLTELSDGDNEGLIFLGTTNHIEKLSGPISRRFSKKIGVKLPDANTRDRLFSFNFGKYKSGIFDGIDIGLLVKKTEDKSHDFINKLIKNTLATCITLGKNRVSIDDLLEHFKMTDDELKGYNEISKMGFKL